jgi:hypothetical protein
MPRSPGRRSDPGPGAYRPHVAARRPGGRPAAKPAFRVLVHHRYLGIWNELPGRVGLANAQQFWDHVAMTPGQPPQVGTSSVKLRARMSGGNGAAARIMYAAGPAVPSAPAPSASAPPRTAVPPGTRLAAREPVHNGSGLRPAAGALPGHSGVAGGGAADVRRPGNAARGQPAAASPAGFSGDGLFVVGLDIKPGVYRTAGPASERNGYFALLKSTNTHDIVNNGNFRGPATITVGPGVKAVDVRHCQPWHRLGDSLDAVIAAAASEPGNTAGRDLECPAIGIISVAWSSGGCPSGSVCGLAG